MQRKTNIAARAARWSTSHRKIAIFGWLAFVVVSIVIGGAVGQKNLTNSEAIPGEAGRAEVAVERSHLDPNAEEVLIQSKTLKTDDPVFVAAVDDTAARLRALPSVTALSSPSRRRPRLRRRALGPDRVPDPRRQGGGRSEGRHGSSPPPRPRSALTRDCGSSSSAGSAPTRPWKRSSAKT